jgi:hypothetical protein
VYDLFEIKPMRELVEFKGSKEQQPKIVVKYKRAIGESLEERQMGIKSIVHSLKI